MPSVHDLALARIRVVLAELAPEIPADEIIPAADLYDDLGLDQLSVWALGVGCEKIAHIAINDADMCALRTVAQLCRLIETEVPEEYADIDELNENTLPGSLPSDSLSSSSLPSSPSRTSSSSNISSHPIPATRKADNSEAHSEHNAPQSRSDSPSGSATGGTESPESTSAQPLSSDGDIAEAMNDLARFFNGE
ncbi:acyl carrier protein [Trueperella sp. LYQ143]|uniref:acyl carrier protein n=1 Tax=unclassified Trueperella TaxID=2630174 RepID=UPI003982E506